MAKYSTDSLDDNVRLELLEGLMLDRKLDDVLQSVAEQATQLTGYPIGLVSLVLKRTQFFRAHVGLPEELQKTMATDRCVSFCQFVVGSGEALHIEDAEKDPNLPQNLVKLYGIKAYAGFPLKLKGQILGSLCVIDTEPNQIKPEHISKLEDLAQEAANRLDELAKMKLPPQKAKPVVTEPSGENFVLQSLDKIPPLMKFTESLRPFCDKVTLYSTLGKGTERIFSIFSEATQSLDDLELAVGNLSQIQNILASREDQTISEEEKEAIIQALKLGSLAITDLNPLVEIVQLVPIDKLMDEKMTDVTNIVGETQTSLTELSMIFSEIELILEVE